MADLKALDAAVAERAKVLIPTIQKKTDKDPGWGYLYGGSKTSPDNLGWRFRQNFRTHHRLEDLPESLNPETILAGKFDDDLVHTYHDAAASEHWYRYEKQYD